MLQNAYICPQDVLLAYNLCFNEAERIQKLSQKNDTKLGICIGNIAQKQQKKQRKRYKTTPRKAALINFDSSAISSPVTALPSPPPSAQPLPLPEKEEQSVMTFLNSFDKHVPSCFDIIKRGTLPGISLQF